MPNWLTVWVQSGELAFFVAQNIRIFTTAFCLEVAKCLDNSFTCIYMANRYIQDGFVWQPHSSCHPVLYLCHSTGNPDGKRRGSVATVLPLLCNNKLYQAGNQFNMPPFALDANLNIWSTLHHSAFVLCLSFARLHLYYSLINMAHKSCAQKLQRFVCVVVWLVLFSASATNQMSRFGPGRKQWSTNSFSFSVWTVPFLIPYICLAWPVCHLSCIVSACLYVFSFCGSPRQVVDSTCWWCHANFLVHSVRKPK